MARHCSAAAFILMALLVITAAASASTSTSATAAGHENHALEFMGREHLYMVLVYPLHTSDPALTNLKQYYVNILKTALRITSERKAEKMLVVSCPPRTFRFIAKLTRAQAYQLQRNSAAVYRVLPTGNALCNLQLDDINNNN